MLKLTDRTNWNIVLWFMLFLCVFIIFSCGNTDEESVDSPLSDNNITNEMTDTSSSTMEPGPNEENASLEAQTITVDATNSESWTYFSFSSGEVIEVTDAENSEEWDLGFQKTKVKLNGGVSGPGMGSAVMLVDSTFEDVTVAPEDGYVSDTDDTLAIVAQSEMGWYIYTGPPTHWVLPLEDRVFVVKTADGTYAKLRFIGYYRDNENKQDSGFVTFEYVHQTDGSRNL